MKWIKASEQLPEYKHNEYIYLRFLDTGKRMLFQPQSEIDLKGELDFLAYHYKLDIVEYLDESPAVSEDVKAQVSDAVEFAEWLRVYLLNETLTKPTKWYSFASSGIVEKTTAELYQLFQQSKQSKS